MSFYELGLDAPLEAFIHDPQTCTRECCRGMRIRSVTTLAGTLMRLPPPLSNDPEMLKAAEELESAPPIESYESSPDTDDLYDETYSAGEYDHEAQMAAEEMAMKEAEKANIRALQMREEATRLFSCLIAEGHAPKEWLEQGGDECFQKSAALEERV